MLQIRAWSRQRYTPQQRVAIMSCVPERASAFTAAELQEYINYVDIVDIGSPIRGQGASYFQAHSDSNLALSGPRRFCWPPICERDHGFQKKMPPGR